MPKFDCLISDNRMGCLNLLSQNNPEMEGISPWDQLFHSIMEDSVHLTWYRSGNASTSKIQNTNTKCADDKNQKSKCAQFLDSGGATVNIRLFCP